MKIDNGHFRSRLTFANVVSVIALFVALGGTAIASVIITSNSQVAQNTISGHKPPSGNHPNIIAGSINGQDIADRSGVDTCQTPLTAKFGAICAGSDAVARTWSRTSSNPEDPVGALQYCASYGLRLPSVSEATTLAQKYDVPGVSSGEHFWTDDIYFDDPSFRAVTVGEPDGDILLNRLVSSTYKTVCVTDPSA
jgi:hypothetical protein